MADVHIYTDGSSRGNPGPGGYGIVMEWVGKPYKKEFSEGYRKTTNNRMELLAVIVALEKLKFMHTDAKVFTDSKYVVDAVEKGWIWGWQKKGFKGKKNIDLWMRFIPLYKNHHVDFIWVKGHAGNPMNERCDELAVNAYQLANLLVDTGYESVE